MASAIVSSPPLKWLVQPFDSLLSFFISVIGIEFGDTYSRVAVQGEAIEHGETIVLANDQGEELRTPNYVAYTSQGILVGQPAKDQALMNPKNTIYEVRYEQLCHSTV
jgi:molecular chaperone DnaK (HSP70)